jgi:FtsP/CotA-like multicopper oxidase with cupredoxin domain
MGFERMFFSSTVRQTTISLYELAVILTKVDQFPGPTIEARSGDILKIEILNFAEEQISLHWHGLHMKGGHAFL